MKTADIISQIRSSSREMVRQFGLLNNRFSSIGSTSQCHALVELDLHGVMNLNQLSTILDLEKSTTSRLVTQLYEQDICHLQADENDRRNKLISLTKKGQLLANKIHQEAELQVKQALALMNEAEKNTVMQGLSIYAKTLKRSRLQTEYSIRKLHKNDVPQLMNLIKVVRAEFGFDSNHPAGLQLEKELNELYNSYKEKKSSYFVLVNAKKIAGGAGFAPLQNADKHICELKGMYLSAQIRGLGLGAFVLEKVIQEARTAQFKRCYLETQDCMHKANALYKKFGFKQLDKPIGNAGHAWTNRWYIKDI